MIERATLQPVCKSCPVGYYQDDFGKLDCILCPKGYTTLGYGSKDVGQCIETAEEICAKSRNICNRGICVVRDRIHYACNCFEGYIGSHCEKRTDICRDKPCQNGGSCIITYNGKNEPQHKCLCFESYFGSSCEQEIDKCPLKCTNDGRCIEYDDDMFMCLCPEGFEGELCQQIVETYCENDLCENNSTCLEKSDSYECKCTRGFIGKRCHLLPCDYNPCPKNAICQNLLEEHATINSFVCPCHEGWTGKECDVKLDFCTPNPCQNGGSCSNLLSSFQCKCSKLYYGIKCENSYDFNYLLTFERFRTADYVKLPPFEKDLTEITVCLWLKVTDTFNYGTLISYATRENDNAFTLTDYTGLIMYVNGQYIATDVFLNDGIWHHVCATWKSTEGIYQVYVDGKLRQFGSGLSTNKKIEAHGYMIIGQEQDALGGKFSQSETFVGRMTLIDIWPRVLTKEQITRHFHDCQNPINGELYSWTEFQFYIQGNLKKEPSPFCQTCSKPKKVINGNVDVREKFAHYKCNEGYTIGNDYNGGRKCLKSSKWEGQREPYCRRVYCGPPGFLKNGFIHGINFYFNDQVTCGCVDGYNLTGTKTLTCGKNGRWEPTKPKCTGPQCRAFKIPLHGTITVFAEMTKEVYKENKTLFDVGTQVEVGCNADTNLIGEAVITCQENGVWDSDPPICESPLTTTAKLIRCSLEQLPNVPEHGYVVEESIEAYQNQITNIVEYNCNIGFKAEGANVSVCIEDGYWSEINLTCNRASCGFPRELVNGLISGQSYMFGDEITFECKKGYSLNGSKSLICGEEGVWEGEPPICIAITCNLPRYLSNGRIYGNGNNFGNTINFKCDDGFMLNGSFTSICEDNGSWSSNSPSCIKIACSPPGGLENGIIFGESYHYQDRISFKCNEGYFINGTEVSECGEEGLWQPSKPSCSRISCGYPGDFENVNIIGNSYYVGDKLGVKCQEGFNLNGGNTLTCDKDGVWKPVKLKCERISCKKISSFENGTVKGSSHLYGDTLIFSCKTGHVLEGNNTAICNENAEWSSIPKCTRIFCDSPGILNHGLIHGNSYYYQDQVVYECNERYNLSGSSTSICTENGDWKPVKPNCLAIPTSTTAVPAIACRNPKIPLNMIKIGEEQRSHYLPGNFMKFDCVEGYKMLGNNIIRCSKYGKWSRLQGKCRRISCRQPEVAETTKIIGESYLYEDIVTIICGNNAKYELKCGKEGIWEGPRDTLC